MKKFMEPAIELEIFAVEDVITASTDAPVVPPCVEDGFTQECGGSDETAYG